MALADGYEETAMTLSERYQAAKAEMSDAYVILDRKSLKARFGGTCSLSGKQITKGDKIVGTANGFALLWVAQAQLTPDVAPIAPVVAVVPEFAADVVEGERNEARIARAEMAMEAIG